MENIFEETRIIMKKYNIKANKSLGQNFLISQEVVNNIIKASEISEKDLVIEIGPGLGTLTKRLLEQAGKVICVELDTKMINILEERFFLYKNLEIIIATLNLKITFVKTNPLVVKNETKTNAIMLQIISINIIDTLITISSIVVLNPKTLSKTIIVHTTRMTGKKLDEKK